MLRAKTKQGKYITLAMLPKEQIETLRHSEQFYCPDCKESLIVRAGPKVIPHFAHYASSLCVQRGGESTYHQHGKLLLYDWLTKQKIRTELEYFLPKIRQRPDLLIKTKKHILAIEYQCATISQAELKDRNDGYRKLNIIPLWILGGNQLKRKSNHHVLLNDFSKTFIHHFSAKTPSILIYFCPQTKLFSFVEDIIMTNVNRALANITFKSLKDLSFTELFKPKFFSNEQLFRLWRHEKRKFRLSPSKVFGEELNWRKWLYSNHLYIEYLPSIVHLPIRSQMKMTVPTWNWQSRFVVQFLQPLQIGDVFSFRQAERFLHRFKIKNNTGFYLFEADPVREYLTLLLDAHIIELVATDHYKKCRQLTFYNHIEQSLKGDDELLQSFMYNKPREQE